MNRLETIRRIARKTGLEQRAAAAVLRLFLAEMEQSLLAGETVQLRPLGTLTTRRRRAKIGRNPLRNEPVVIGEHLTVVFKPSPGLKKKLNR